MALGKLSDLQARVLHGLADLNPPWTLTGGAALAGFHTRHRATRDLDLFWPGLDRLDNLPTRIVQALAALGLDVAVIQRSPAFCRLRVADTGDTVVVDLVAEPVAAVEASMTVSLGDATIRVDTPHEILVNKLCSLLSRAEPRDLDDVQALRAAGGDLERALDDAPRKDGGFSPLTLAWVLRELPVAQLATRAGYTAEAADDLARFRDQLIQEILLLTAPDDSK